MRTLTVDTSKDTVALDTLFALQPRTANEPFLPRLKIFVCEEATEAFIPFIPSFLSRQTTWIDIRFTANTPMVMIASMITGLSTLCLDLECITLNRLPRDPVITEAVSKILLACNQDTLQWFCVDSPLTEEAREVVYRLPKLSGMWVIIQGNTLLPPVALPNLTSIDIEYDDYLGWLQGFHGATLEKLEDIYLRSKSKQIGDFLGKFGSVALTTSVSATLSTFNFNTSSSWNPNYRSLLPFTQLKDLVIGSSCGGGCSSRVDDNIIMDLVRAMPKLEILKLGDTPCETPTGVTVKGLIALAYGCCHLSRLRIHFQTASLVEATASSETPYPSNEPMVQRQDCALTDLEVGEIPVQPSDALRVAMTLLQIFPRLSNIEYIGEGWHSVGETIELSKQIGTFLHRTGEAHQPYL